MILLLNARFVLCALPILLAGCSQPVNPSFPVTHGDANCAIAQMRAHPHRLQRPLVVIGGFLDLNVSPPLFKAWFRGVVTDGPIVPVSVGLCGSFDDCRRKVIEAVDKACPSNDPSYTTEVDVVGASLGGLVARYAAAPSLDDAHPRRLRIARLFTISSPHGGATLAQAIALSDYHRDLRPDSRFIQAVARADADATYELIPYVHLHDEIVGPQYAAPPGKAPYWLANPPLTPAHFGAMIDPRILADISRRLRDEEPLTKGPPAPLPEKSTFPRS